MKTSHNCYMNSSDDNKKFLAEDGNFTGPNLDFPFEDQTYESGHKGNFRFRNARLKNNFRLNEANGLAGNKCLNGGTTNVGNGIILPETDMDYTNRIKDCAIDIGAYEADNNANIAPQKKTNSANIIDYIYYVTQNGWGNRSGDSPENAACADRRRVPAYKQAPACTLCRSGKVGIGPLRLHQPVIPYNGLAGRLQQPSGGRLPKEDSGMGREYGLP